MMKNELTANEKTFVYAFLAYNDCGAQTPESLLEGGEEGRVNHNCQCMENLEELFPMLNSKQIGGYLSSLIQKEVIWVEERKDNPFQKLPDLFWVSSEFVEGMDPTFNWSGLWRAENIKFV